MLSRADLGQLLDERPYLSRPFSLVFDRLACLFLKRGANINAMDVEGKDPLSIAMDMTNADIVTL